MAISNTLSRKLQKKRNELHQYGVMYVIRKWLHDHAYAREQVYILKRDLSLPMPDINRRRQSTIEIRLLEGEQELESFTPLMQQSRPQVERWLKAGFVCVVALVDKSAVAFLWFTTDRFYDSELDYCYECQTPDEVYQGVFVHEDYRGSPILLEMFRCGWQHFHDLGYDWVVGSVVTRNWRSLRVHQRLGFVEKGIMLHTTRLLGWRRSRVEEYTEQRLLNDEMSSTGS